MNPGQEQFLGFFLMNTKEDKQEQAKTLLLESFKAQETKAFTLDDFTSLQNNLLPLLKEESLDDVKKAMAHFASQLG